MQILSRNATTGDSRQRWPRTIAAIDSARSGSSDDRRVGRRAKRLTTEQLRKVAHGASLWNALTTAAAPQRNAEEHQSTLVPDLAAFQKRSAMSGLFQGHVVNDEILGIYRIACPDQKLLQ